MRVNKRLLVISNYPIKQPMHGGQKRVAAIVKEYKKHFSHVRFAAIFIREHYPVYAPSDLYLTGRWADYASADHLTSDIRIAEAMAGSPRLRRRIKKLLTTFRPDIIEIEQVFPYIGLKDILKELNMHPKIIHSSHNIEAPMRRDIMKIGGASPEDIDKAVGTIETTDKLLARTADLVATVSRSDGEALIKEGAKTYVLAPNGIELVQPSERTVRHWRNLFAQQGVTRFALFVGSAHLPNMQGIRQLIGGRLGFIPYDCRLVFAGNVGNHLREHFDDSALLDQPFWHRAYNAGTPDEDHLAGLLATAEVIILPILSGGGSNLKTAEAILSGKKIVATSFAFRGFEQYLQLPNIWIADERIAFTDAIAAALRAPLKPRTEAEDELAGQVQWKYSLKELVEGAKTL